jgi:uncharacterized tellurite resistance protein B-like protein
MLEFVRDFFIKSTTDSQENIQKEAHKVQIATCALFLEMAKIDDKFSDEEMEAILSILKDKYHLSGEHADHLIKEAEEGLKKSIDLWQFASLIDEHYSIEEKLEVIELLWKIVFVDGKMNKYEDYLMHKLTRLLRLSDRQLIDAKLKVLHGGST